MGHKGLRVRMAALAADAGLIIPRDEGDLSCIPVRLSTLTPIFGHLSMDKHPWLRPSDGSIQALGGLEKLRRDYLVADYLRNSVGQNIVATVHIEAVWDAADPVGETEWLDGLDKSRGVAIRYTAAAPFGTPRAAEILERQAAHKRVVGIRDILSFHPTSPEKSFASRGDKAEDPSLAPRHRSAAGPRPDLRIDDVSLSA